MSNPFQFGTPSTSAGSNTPPVFGTAGASPFSQPASGKPSGGLFGNIGATPTTTTGSSSSSLFTTTPETGQTASLFGGQGSKPTFGGTPSSNPFGNPSNPGQASATNLFGSASQTPKSTEPASSGQTQTVLFGEAGKTAPGTGGLFGNATPAPSNGASLFGNMSTTPAGPPPQTSAGQGLFTSQASTKPGESASLFGQKPASSTSFGSLGVTTNALSSAAAPTTTAAAPSLFKGASQSQTPSTGNLFASPAAKGQAVETGKPQAKPTPPLFDAPAISTTPQASGSLFNTPGTSGAQSQQKPFSFPSSKPTSGAFTPATMSETAQKPLFGATAVTTTPSTTSTTTAAPAAGLFAGLITPKTNTPKDSTTPATTSSQPAGGMFSLGKPTTTTAPVRSQATTSAAGATTTAAPTTGATTATTSAGGTTSTPATASGLGASTVGPAPPAQSRLKNKTMDEIITRWATDLTKYQKEFQEQAEQVADWDRMLVENGTKVQKLYGNTVDAERATQEVERQLASVEGQQDELSSWLDRYEQEVEALLSKQVGITDSLQGPDQERERTYKLAERLSERLNEMGQDLTSMIEEVNSASSTLSKTSKSDEPISQIVRILNSHLSQLQLIDQGTANLHAKIAAAQKLGGSLSAHQHQGTYSQLRNGIGNGMGGGGAADDFYRAYMGRR
ncbi:nucleoporin Nsp1 [Blastomyces dermatitidis ATCC 18188]|uniref:Nucleoporin NSP1 n=1 Tax=Ajellomyces dermatitidis (strain ATCC 18188 / CBS 674.68) TaxID=653446 RepID=F2TMQ1_AJEDA|nr:nucleoporin Nsp1 [Blastomyces dermatitidis ATCC 18188]